MGHIQAVGLILDRHFRTDILDVSVFFIAIPGFLFGFKFWARFLLLNSYPGGRWTEQGCVQLKWVKNVQIPLFVMQFVRIVYAYIIYIGILNYSYIIYFKFSSIYFRLYQHVNQRIRQQKQHIRLGIIFKLNIAGRVVLLKHVLHLTMLQISQSISKLNQMEMSGTMSK